jgi:hypothetical protein
MLSVMPWIKQAIDLEEAAKQRHCTGGSRN